MVLLGRDGAGSRVSFASVVFHCLNTTGKFTFCYLHGSFDCVLINSIRFVPCLEFRVFNVICNLFNYLFKDYVVAELVSCGCDWCGKISHVFGK